MAAMHGRQRTERREERSDLHLAKEYMPSHKQRLGAVRGRALDMHGNWGFRWSAGRDFQRRQAI